MNKVKPLILELENLTEPGDVPYNEYLSQLIEKGLKLSRRELYLTPSERIGRSYTQEGIQLSEINPRDINALYERAEIIAQHKIPTYMVWNSREAWAELIEINSKLQDLKIRETIANNPTNECYPGEEINLFLVDSFPKIDNLTTRLTRICDKMPRPISIPKKSDSTEFENTDLKTKSIETFAQKNRIAI